MYTIYIELWTCDLLKATTDDAPNGDRTGDPSAQGPMRYRLRQPAPHKDYKTWQIMSMVLDLGIVGKLLNA